MWDHVWHTMLKYLWLVFIQFGLCVLCVRDCSVYSVYMFSPLNSSDPPVSASKVPRFIHVPFYLVSLLCVRTHLLDLEGAENDDLE